MPGPDVLRGDRVDPHGFAAHADAWEPASDRARAALRS